MVITIVLKPNLDIDPRQGLSWEGQLELTQIKKKSSNLVLTKKIKKKTTYFLLVFYLKSTGSQVNLDF